MRLPHASSPHASHAASTFLTTSISDSYASSILSITHEFIREIDRPATPFPPYVALLSVHALVLAGIDPGDWSIAPIIS